jgi:hypothetical protein
MWLNLCWMFVRQVPGLGWQTGYRQSRSKIENIIITTAFDFDWLIEISNNCHFISENGLSAAYTYFRSFLRKNMTTALSWSVLTGKM